MRLPPGLHAALLVRRQVELGPLTTLGVGGPAPWVVEPRGRDELALAVAGLVRGGLPFRLLGGGVFGDMPPGIPASQLAVIPGASHVSVRLRAELLVPIVTTFLDAPMPKRD